MKIFEVVLLVAFCFMSSAQGNSEGSEPQIRSRIRLSDLMAPEESKGPKQPKDVLREQRNLLRQDRTSYNFFGSAGSRLDDFIFEHSDESTSFRIE